MTQRRRFQVSLRTSIILTLLTGAFVGANVVTHATLERRFDYMDTSIPMTVRGWPVAFENWYPTLWPNDVESYEFKWSALAWNAVVLLLALGSVWAVLERPWRRSDVKPGA